jgi:hypothetical protein
LPRIIFDSISRWLILTHALAAVVLLGAATHNAVVTVGMLRGLLRPRLGKIYTAVVAAAYVAVMASGAMAYPSYRYWVRGLYFDRYAPWAANLFDIKENFAALGLPLAIGALLVRHTANPDEDASVRLPYSIAVFALTAITWFNFLAGLLVTLERGSK